MSCDRLRSCLIVESDDISIFTKINGAVDIYLWLIWRDEGPILCIKIYHLKPCDVIPQKTSIIRLSIKAAP